MQASTGTNIETDAASNHLKASATLRTLHTLQALSHKLAVCLLIIAYHPAYYNGQTYQAMPVYPMLSDVLGRCRCPATITPTPETAPIESSMLPIINSLSAIQIPDGREWLRMTPLHAHCWRWQGRGARHQHQPQGTNNARPGGKATAMRYAHWFHTIVPNGYAYALGLGGHATGSLR